MSNILDEYKDIYDIKKMDYDKLDEFSGEIRTFLIEKLSKTGGHLASNLGIVELTLSLYKVFDFNIDKIVWDVGHQAYVHKILTGRKEEFKSIRKYGGISGFPKRSESKYDFFDTGHSSTSISAALGIARTRDLEKKENEVIAVIGDGALTGGMALEALNDVGDRKTKLIIILNDNGMSIGENVGGVSTYLSKIRVDPKYNKFRDDFDKLLNKIPNLGKGISKSIDRMKDSIKQLIVPGMLFEDMGIKYLGPIDGHNIKELSLVLSQAKQNKGPVLIHVITKKGKGYKFAENDPDLFHGVGPFDCSTGKCAKKPFSYSKAFGENIVLLASENKKLIGITAAMKDGTGLGNFALKYPERYFDVGIAEQHAVTLAAGMASNGFRPIFAVYSTFLQRAYDQIIHDVCMQNIPVIFAIDRAGIVGEDGETHQGVYDLSYLSHMPNMTIMAPKCIEELFYIMNFALKQPYPIAIRYPRGGDMDNVKLSPYKNFKKGKWEVVLEGEKLAIIAVGKMVQKSILVCEKLKEYNINSTVINACFIKPIDEELIKKLIKQNYKIVTIEDGVIIGGFGSLVLNFINSLEEKVNILNIGFEDEFIPHGDPEILYRINELDINGIINRILKFYNLRR
ncbi:MAG: 1-deoxy-D-xylulose-5-phosphate synthase [Clostridiaceae bacterium]